MRQLKIQLSFRIWRAVNGQYHKQIISKTQVTTQSETQRTRGWSYIPRGLNGNWLWATGGAVTVTDISNSVFVCAPAPTADDVPPLPARVDALPRSTGLATTLATLFGTVTGSARTGLETDGSRQEEQVWVNKTLPSTKATKSETGRRSELPISYNDDSKVLQSITTTKNNKKNSYVRASDTHLSR